MSSGVKFILSRIERNDTSLCIVDLQYENIDDTIAIQLAHSLCTNTVVQTLNLQSNKISDTGAIALSQCLCVNTTITTINISKNNIYSNGIIALLQSLQQSNRTVSTLDIRYNKYHVDNVNSRTLAVAVAETLRYNPILQYFHITVPVTRTQQQQQQQSQEDSIVQSIVSALEQYNDTIIGMNITSSNNYSIQNELKQIKCIIIENQLGKRTAPYKMGHVRSIIYQQLLQEWIPQYYSSASHHHYDMYNIFHQQRHDTTQSLNKKPISS
jgi:Leucine Rich repeat